MVNKKKLAPLRAPDMIIYACVGVVYLLYNESTWSETVNYVNAEWDSNVDWVSPSETLRQLSQRRMSQYFWIFHNFALTQLTWSPIPTLTQSTRSLTWCWLSWRGMRLYVNWVTAEWKKNVAKFKNKIGNTQKPYSKTAIKVWSVQRSRTKISIKCTFKADLECHLWFAVKKYNKFYLSW